MEPGQDRSSPELPAVTCAPAARSGQQGSSDGMRTLQAPNLEASGSGMHGSPGALVWRQRLLPERLQRI